MRITRRLRVNAPRPRVWELIDDDSQLSKWMPHVTATRYPGGKPAEKSPGTRFVHELRHGDLTSSYEGEITEYKPGSLLGMLMLPEAIRMHAVYHVTGDDDWTLLEYGCDVRPASWKGWLMLALSKRQLNRIVDQQLALLKLVAEGKIETV